MRFTKIVAAILALCTTGLNLTPAIFKENDKCFNQKVLEREQKIIELISQESEALISGNNMRYQKIRSELDSYGVESMTSEEVLFLQNNTISKSKEHQNTVPFNSTATTFDYSDSSIISYGKHNKFERFSQDFIHNGKEYTYMAIVAVPSDSNSALYREGTVIQKKSDTFGALSSLFSTAITSLMGRYSRTFNIVATIYDALKDVVNNLSTTTQYKEFNGTYDYVMTQYCYYTYLLMDGYDYHMVCDSNQVNITISSSIKSLTTIDGTLYADINVYKQSGVYVAEYFANPYQICCEKIDSGMYARAYSRLDSFNILGVNDQTVAEITVPDPINPGVLGYNP